MGVIHHEHCKFLLPKKKTETKALTSNFKHKTQNYFHIYVASEHFFNHKVKGTL